MKIKAFLLSLCMAIVLQSCKKKNDVTPNQLPLTTFSLAAIFQNNMVIQRDKPFTIWGKAPAGNKIVVHVSWQSDPYTANTDYNYNWKIVIPAAPANSAPQTISAGVDGAVPSMLMNVLIGDVWICSGQSNMVMPVDLISPFPGVTNYQQEIAGANYPQIRAFTVLTNSQPYTVDTLSSSSKWNECSPSTVGQMSAVAYFFARKLNTALNVPIGIIISAINNTNCQQWTNMEGFQSDPSLASVYPTLNGPYYNGMIYPLINLSIKGFIWYQGENNEHDDPTSYAKLNSALINGWRTVFNQGSLPFYYVQLTPFDIYGTMDATLDDYAKLREGQALIRNMVTNSGMAVTMDAGEVSNHHPQNKQPVGERLALLALKNDYGQNVISTGPTFSSYTVNNNTVTISFADGTANGLTTAGNAPVNQYFFVAGADHVFKRGTAVINGNAIVVTASPDTQLPIQAVRYAFTNFPVTNIQNASGLPMEPFRTDDWSN